MRVDQSLTPLKARSYSLSAPPLADAIVKFDRKQNPTFAVNHKDNQIELVVYTNSQGDTKNKGMIKSPLLDVPDFEAILETIKLIASDTAPSDEVIEIPLKGFFFGPGGRSDEKIVLCTVVVGKQEKTGQIYIALTSKNRPKIRFFFGPNSDMNLIKNGQPMEPGAISQLWARAWCRKMSQIVAATSDRNYVTWQEIKERKEANKNNRGGSYGGGSGQSHSDSSGGGSGGDIWE